MSFPRSFRKKIPDPGSGLQAAITALFHALSLSLAALFAFGALYKIGAVFDCDFDPEGRKRLADQTTFAALALFVAVVSTATLGFFLQVVTP